MDPSNLLPMEPRDSRLCTAHRSDGEMCTRWAIAGGRVCPSHGGASPAVANAAKARLLEAADPATAELVKLATEADSESVRLRACVEILNRVGLSEEAPPDGRKRAGWDDITGELERTMKEWEHQLTWVAPSQTPDRVNEVLQTLSDIGALPEVPSADDDPKLS